MKRCLYLILPLIIFLSGCKKDDPEPEDQGIEVSFNFSKGLKKDSGGDYDCFDGEGDYAYIVISGEEYFLDVFYLYGRPYTKSIMLPTRGTYVLEEFMLMYDNNTPGVESDDSVIMAAPHTGSELAAFVETPLHYTFVAEEYDVLDISIQVVCYEAANYDKFGFEYFEYDDYLERQECFYGYLCVHTMDDYTGSLYENQGAGLQNNMPAIFKIEGYRNDILQDTVFSNESWLGEGQPLCVVYEDRNYIVDEFEFRLYVYVDVKNQFEYRYFHSWYRDDAQAWNHGSNGMMDFIVGTCATDVDVRLPNYMDLPPDCNFKIIDSEPGASTNAYLDSKLSGIADKYDLTNGIWPGWSIDTAVDISSGTIQMEVFSSLYPVNMPHCIKNYNWKAANWLLNHLDYYPGYEWWELQQGLWQIGVGHDGTAIGGVPASTPLSEQMALDAINNSPTWQGPFMGDMAAVVFLPEGTDPYTLDPKPRIIFTVVDP